MILIRLLHRITSCRSAADGASMFSCRKIDRTQYVTETVPCRFATNSIICFGLAESIFHTKFYLPVRITLSRHRPRHLKLKVMEHVRLSCQFWLATTHGVVSASCLLSRGVNVMSCLAMSCPIKQHHGRWSQGAATVRTPPNLARDASNPIRFWNRATST